MPYAKRFKVEISYGLLWPVVVFSIKHPPSAVNGWGREEMK